MFGKQVLQVYQNFLLVNLTRTDKSFNFAKPYSGTCLNFPVFRQSLHSKLTWCHMCAKTCSWHFKSVKTEAESSPPLSRPTSSSFENKQTIYRCRALRKIVSLCGNAKGGTISEEISCIGIEKARCLRASCKRYLSKSWF